MEINSSIGERLEEERSRLGLSQTETAQVAKELGVPGATRQSQARYEKGQAAPSAAYMSAIATSGFDVLYILTGQRSAAGTVSATAELPPGEQLLLEAYRDLPVAKQKQLLADLLVGNAGKKAARKMDAGSDTVVATGKRSQAAGRDIVNSPRKE